MIIVSPGTYLRPNAIGPIRLFEEFCFAEMSIILMLKFQKNVTTLKKLYDVLYFCVNLVSETSTLCFMYSRTVYLYFLVAKWYLYN
jgi:hypothetical protein